MVDPDPLKRPSAAAVALSPILCPQATKSRAQLRQELNEERFKNQMLSRYKDISVIKTNNLQLEVMKFLYTVFVGTKLFKWHFNKNANKFLRGPCILPMLALVEKSNCCGLAHITWDRNYIEYGQNMYILNFNFHVNDHILTFWNLMFTVFSLQKTSNSGSHTVTIQANISMFHCVCK